MQFCLSLGNMVVLSSSHEAETQDFLPLLLKNILGEERGGEERREPGDQGAPRVKGRQNGWVAKMARLYMKGSQGKAPQTLGLWTIWSQVLSSTGSIEYVF